MSKDKFLKAYANLSEPEREQVIAIVDNKTYSMKHEIFDLEEEKKNLVLARLKTLRPDSKIMLGGGKEVSVHELMKHVEEGDEFGKNIIKAQIRMLQVLTSGAQ